MYTVHSAPLLIPEKEWWKETTEQTNMGSYDATTIDEMMWLQAAVTWTRFFCVLYTTCAACYILHVDSARQGARAAIPAMHMARTLVNHYRKHLYAKCFCWCGTMQLCTHSRCFKVSAEQGAADIRNAKKRRLFSQTFAAWKRKWFRKELCPIFKTTTSITTTRATKRS